MSAISGIPSLLKKDDFLLDTPVYINRVRCEMPNTAVVGLASLHQHQFIEVSCVLAWHHRLVRSIILLPPNNQKVPDRKGFCQGRIKQSVVPP